MSSLIQEVKKERMFNIMMTVYPLDRFFVPIKQEKQIHLLENVEESIARRIVLLGKDSLFGRRSNFSYQETNHKNEKGLTIIDIVPYKNEDVIIFKNEHDISHQYNFAITFEEMETFIDQLTLVIDQPKMYENVIFN